MTAAASGQPASSSRDVRNWFALVGLALALFCYLSLFQQALIDDAFITLCYAKTLLHSGTWGFYPGHISNTATSPLNVLLLAAVSVVTRSPLAAVPWLTTIELIALAMILRGIGIVVGLEFFAPIAFVGLVCNPLLMSTLGLESILFATLLSAALYFFLSRRFEAMALACGLLTLTRPDGILFFAICLITGPNDLRGRVRALGIYALCIAPWYVFSWVELGSLVPDTLIIKLNQSWGRFTFALGLARYFRTYPFEIGLSFLYAPVAIFALRRSVRVACPCVHVIMAYAIIYYASYALIGAPPYHWYYAPSVISMVLLGAFVLGQLVRDAISSRGRRIFVAAGLVVPIAGIAALLVRDGIPLREAWIQTNWATHSQYRSIGEWLRAHHGGETGVMDGEVGTIAYYCDCFALNDFSDRRWLTARIARSEGSAGLSGFANRLNSWFYRPQQPFDRPVFMISYLQMFADSIRTGQIWRVGTRWKNKGVIVYSAL